MTSSGPSTAPAGAGGPKPLPQPAHSEAVKEKKDLASWWRNFKKSDKKAQDQGTHSRKQVLDPSDNSPPTPCAFRGENIAPDA